MSAGHFSHSFLLLFCSFAICFIPTDCETVEDCLLSGCLDGTTAFICQAPTGTLPASLPALCFDTIERIRIQRGEVNGTLPSEWSQMTRLKDLSFERNNFEGTLPPEWSKMSNLEFIDFGHNMISGTLPPEWGNMTNMRFLTMNDNKFSGSLPPEWSSIPQIHTINLENNELVGSLPPQWSAFSPIIRMVLSSNNISGTLPPQWSNMTNIGTLELEDNQIQGKLPPQWANMTGINFLLLQQNKLTGSLPEAFSEMDRLRRLYLNDNFLNSSLPSSWAGTLMLLDLDISGNQISGTLPSSWGNTPAGAHLNMRDNRIFGSLPTQWSALSNLNLDIANNRITGPLPGNWSHITGMDFLDVTNNSINGTLPAQWSNLSQLETLLLANNEITGTFPKEWANFSSLSTLFTAGNDFDRDCDCRVIESYQIMRDVISDRFNLDPCSDVNEFSGISPFIIVQDEGTPCAHVPIGEIEIKSRDFRILWNNSDHNNLTNFTLVFNDDNFVFPDTTIGFAVDKCTTERVESMFDLVSFGYYEHRRSGFEIQILEGDIAIETVCFFANELIADHGYDFQYQVDSGILPATLYGVTVRPFDFVFLVNQDDGRLSTQLLFGPKTDVFPVLTADAIPEVAPINLKQDSARSGELLLSWEMPLGPGANGDIIAFEVSCFDEDGTTIVIQVNTNTAFVRSLRADTDYVCQVKAATSAGFSEVSSEILVARTCPENMNKVSNASECVADVGFFKSDSGEAKNCESEIGTNFLEESCSTEAIRVESLNIKEGFWRPNVDDFTEILSCPRSRFCNKETGTQIDAAILAIEPESVQCRIHHRGTYCFGCEEGFELSLPDGCNECTDKVKKDHRRNFAFLVLVVIMVVTSCTVYVYLRAKTKSKMKISWCPNVKIIWKQVTDMGAFVGVKLRIFESFLQVLFAFQSILFVNGTSSLFGDILNAFANVDFGIFAYRLSVECAIDVNHYSVLALQTLPPIILFLSILSLFRFVRNYTTEKSFHESIKKECYNMFFIVSFLIYPGTSRIILNTFVCEDFDSVEEESNGIFKSALRSDYRLTCEATGERIFWLVFASCMVIIFPFGIIMAYYVSLKSYNSAEGEERENLKVLLIDLLYPYKEEVYWFEVYDLIRKLFQTSGVALCLSFGVKAATTVALNISVAFLMVLIYVKPYRKSVDTLFCIFTYVVLIFSTQLSLWFESTNCDSFCQADKISGAFILMIFLVLVVGILITFAEKRGWFDNGSSEVLKVRSSNASFSDLRMDNPARLERISSKNTEDLL